MVKRSESLRENTFRYTENGCNPSKTNLLGSKSLPSTPLCRSSPRDFALTKSAQRGISDLGLDASLGSLGETISEERETGTANRPECCGLGDGQAVDQFYFTGEDTSLFEDNKDISLVKPQVPPESAPQEELEDDVEDGNQFNVLANEGEAFFTFTGSDTSLLEQTNTASSASSSTEELEERNTDTEMESLASLEAQKSLHTISKPDSCNEADIDNSTNEMLENIVIKRSMEPRQVNSVPVSLSTSFTGSIDESNVDQERPKSLYRELNRIGNMSLVQSKLMSWKAMEEHYNGDNGKQLLPFGCSGAPKRKNSKPSKCDEDVEVTTTDDSLQSDELNAALLSVIESQDDYIKEEPDDKEKEGSEPPIISVESVQNTRIESHEIDQSGEGINCETDQSNDGLEIVQSGDEIGALVADDKDETDQSDSLDHCDLSDIEVEGVNSESPEVSV
jgi:hypothetical protein